MRSKTMVRSPSGSHKSPCAAAVAVRTNTSIRAMITHLFFVPFRRPASDISCIHVYTGVPLKASNLQNLTLVVFQSEPNGESQSCHFLICLKFPACPPIGESQFWTDHACLNFRRLANHTCFHTKPRCNYEFNQLQSNCFNHESGMTRCT